MKELITEAESIFTTKPDNQIIKGGLIVNPYLCLEPASVTIIQSLVRKILAQRHIKLSREFEYLKLVKR